MRHVPEQDRPFPTDPAGLPEATGPDLVDLADGAAFELRITPVAKRLRDMTVRMLGYNGSIPGPTLRVRQGSAVDVEAINQGDLETTVHWHGLRLENRHDGVPHQTQKPIPVGGSHTSRLRFPDPGLYWYHPHVREDYAQELGLYGNIVVVPAQDDYWPAADREMILTLDDILLEGGGIAPFSRSHTTHAAMGRFGNLLLVAGDPDLSLTAGAGEVVRLYLTNTAGARVFNVRLPGARMKLVGGDSGRYERAEFVSEVLLAPSERAVVDVLADRPGELILEHRTPERSHRLATITVTAARPGRPGQGFETLPGDPELAAERARLAPYIAAPPDKTLALTVEMDDLGEAGSAGYACPMHPEVSSPQPGRCPQCGMKLLSAHQIGQATADHAAHGMHHDMDHEMHHDMAPEPAAPHHHHDGDHEPGDGIEWEDDMAAVSPLTTTANTRWKFIDRDSGAENAAIDWRFEVGQRVKIRLVNEMDSDHPMHHPFHVHGAGRFLVLTRDGAVEPNLVWKDTVLVRTGQTVDILLDVTNPGLWMAHCHIAEHMESGMMFSFHVTEPAAPTA